MTKRLLFLGIMTALTLTVLVQGARTMVAQVQATPSSAAHPAKPSNKAAMTAQPGLLSAATVIVYEVANAQYRGTVSANATDSDCRALTFAITDDVHVTFTRDGGMPEEFQVFYPGIALKFVGHTCIPAKGAEFTSHQHINFSGGFGLMNGTLSAGDAVTLGGVVTTSLDPETAVVEFDASPNDPFVFEITKRGYMYVSGSGRVTLPSGKVYNFPLSQSSTDKPTAGAASSNSLAGCLVKSGDGYKVRNAKYPKGVEASLSEEFQDDAGYFVTLSGHWGVYPKSGEYGTISVGSGGQMTTSNVVHVFVVDGVTNIGKVCAPAAANATPNSGKIAPSPRVTVSGRTR